MQRITNLLVFLLVLLSINSISARYVSSTFSSNSIRYAIFKNDCYVLDENNIRTNKLVVNQKVQPNIIIDLCENLVVKSESEIDERYLIIVKMDYIDDIRLLANDIYLEYDFNHNYYASNWIDLNSKEIDTYDLKLVMGQTSINLEMGVSILIEQRD